MKYDAIVVGGGIAGLTSAAFLIKEGYKVLLCEKESHTGGLVNSFVHDGFLFDAGVRGIVDSGIVKPMLKQLELDVEFTRSIVSIGIEDEMIEVKDLESLKAYQAMLEKLYPDNIDDIEAILNDIKKVMDYMDILYGIENPLFKDLKHDKEYLKKSLLPWLFKYLSKSGKIKHFKAPIDEYLAKLTNNQSLIDIISQHFFQKTPASFALSYFSLYLDYEYPKQGTIALVDAIRDYILAHNGEILTNTLIKSVDVTSQVIYDQENHSYNYDQLIWAADMNQLYQAVDESKIANQTIRTNIYNHKQSLKGKRGGDSIYSVFLEVDLDKDYFTSKTTGHCFYTPKKNGHSFVFNQLKDISHSVDKTEIMKWMNDYLEYTTYEIAIPSLRNQALAPEGKTGLVVSVLMDYDFIKNIQSLGFYEEFKQFSEYKMIEVLNNSLFKGIEEKMITHFSSTPLTYEKYSGNLDGGITGWAFTNKTNPAVSKMGQVIKSCYTKMPNILQAGQWTFSPSGLPISILTGKIASDRAVKALKRRK